MLREREVLKGVLPSNFTVAGVSSIAVKDLGIISAVGFVTVGIFALLRSKFK